MKSTTTKKWTSIILAVLLIFGCCAVAFADPASAGSGSMSDNYETYFTKVHEIAEFPDADGKYTLRDGVIYLDGFYMGWSDDPAERTVLDDVPFYDDCDVALFRPTNSYIYFVEKDGRDIRRLDLATMRVRTIYEGETPISELAGDDNCLFFRAEDRLYRMYVKTGEAHEVLRIPDSEHYMKFEDWDDTNVEILYWTDEDRTTALPGILAENSAGYFDEEGGLAFMLNCNTGALHGESSEEYYQLRSTLGTEITLTPEEFTNDLGEEVSILNFTNMAIREKIGTFYYSHQPGSTYTATYGGARQCTAFAKNVYAVLYGYPESNVFRNGTERKFFDGKSGTNYQNHNWVYLNSTNARTIPDGSHARVHFPTNSTSVEGGHSIMVLSRTDTDIIVYDANRENDNKVRMTKFTISEFISKFTNINYYDNPSAKSGHVHNSSRCSSLNKTTHAYYCTCYTQRTTESHKFVQQEIADQLWINHCTKCGFEDAIN